jgi:hypothetical protein
MFRRLLSMTPVRALHPPGHRTRRHLPKGHPIAILAHELVRPAVRFPHLATGNIAELADLIRARSARLQTLGNSTLLNKYLNPAASNGPFDVKLIEYKHSLLRLNRYLDERTNWDEEAIGDRSKVLGQLLCGIWTRPSGGGS